MTDKLGLLSGSHKVVGKACFGDNIDSEIVKVLTNSTRFRFFYNSLLYVQANLMGNICLFRQLSDREYTAHVSHIAIEVTPDVYKRQTQNELNGEDAQHLIDNKVTCVGEISNMGCTPEAIDLFIDNKIMYAPGKAVNAGGVATSGLEMSQNAMHLSWSAAEVDEKLHAIMHGIHAQCVKYGTEPDGYINYVKGANIAGFMKVAHAMMGQGII